MQPKGSWEPAWIGVWEGRASVAESVWIASGPPCPPHSFALASCHFCSWPSCLLGAVGLRLYSLIHSCCLLSWGYGGAGGRGPRGQPPEALPPRRPLPSALVCDLQSMLHETLPHLTVITNKHHAQSLGSCCLLAPGAKFSQHGGGNGVSWPPSPGRAGKGAVGAGGGSPSPAPHAGA